MVSAVQWRPATRPLPAQRQGGANPGFRKQTRIRAFEAELRAGGPATRITSGQSASKVNGAQAMTPADVVEIVQDEGYRAKLVTNEGGSQGIETKIRYNTYISISMRTDQLGVASLRFSATFSDKVTLEGVNAWNSDKRYVSAYILADGGHGFQMDAVMAGATRETLAFYLSVWEGLMVDVTKVT
jgi:hypothetical protein